MAKRSFQASGWTPTATADTTNLVNASYMAIQGGSSTQLINVSKIYCVGMAGSSSPTLLQWARDSTVGAGGLTALAAPNSDGPLHPSTAPLAAPAGTFVAAATPPQRSAVTTAARLNLGLNAFGGISRFDANPGEEWVILGNTQPLGESSLSAFTGGTAGLISAHLVYEPL